VIPDEAVEAAAKVMQARDAREGLGEYALDQYTEEARELLEAAAPALIAALANEREGDLFRFTLSQREWLRKGLAK